MKSTTLPTRQQNRWQDDLNDLIREPDELFRLLALDPHTQAEAAHRQFPLRVTRAFVRKMQKGNINDPLLRQVLPQGQEMLPAPGYSNDPLQESAANPYAGLIHKYHSRVLLLVSGSCAIHCRYCFRRHFPYQENRPSREQWQPVLSYLASHPEINEVIYSGGDPLSAPDKQLAWLTRQIAAIEHIKRLRIHTRMPIVLPHRIDNDCLAWMTETRLQTIVVLHCNHAQEIDRDTFAMVARLRRQGITVLNQTVLLKGVNDAPATMIALNEKLFEAGILPYYLHLLDKVSGTQHFDLPLEAARELYSAMQEKLPGFLLPRLVQEQPGAVSKTLIL